MAANAFVGIFDDRTDKRQAFLDHRTALAFAFQADDTVVFNIHEDIETLLDIFAIYAIADGTLADSDSGQFTAQRGCKRYRSHP